MKHPERYEQMKLVALVREFHPDLLFWHTPSGELRSKKVGVTLLQMGTRPGVPDLFFPTLRYFIEMKAPGEDPSPEQIGVMAELRANGYSCAVFVHHRAAFDYLERRIRQFAAGARWA